ncbi:MAG TPA: HDIG domain-containing protein, partial [Treponema sp.]|nr:HDIG domain-containing protein [Treponema sp.]
ILFAILFSFLCIATYFSTIEVNGLRQLSLSDFEVGKVADRDVIASRELSYIDEEATRIRLEARKKLVPAVFKYDDVIAIAMSESFRTFTNFLEELFIKKLPREQFVLEFQQEYPGVLNPAELKILYAEQNKEDLIKSSRSVYRQLLTDGVAAFPDEGMENFNSNLIEIIRQRNGREERNEVSKDTMITIKSLDTWIKNTVSLLSIKTIPWKTISMIVTPFVHESILFQGDESEKKMDSSLRQVTPVKVSLNKGQKIIKRGFIITDDSYLQLEALALSGVQLNSRKFFASLMWIALIALLALFVFSPIITGIRLEFRMSVVLSISFFVLFLITLIARKGVTFSMPLDTAILLPAALISMLITILLNKRLAVLNAFVCSMGVYVASDFFAATAIFTLLSGVAGASVVQISGKRIDLVKSAGFLALINPLIMLALVGIIPDKTQDIPAVLMGSSVNGFMSGILVLGFLPILETLLNTSTSFRLMEFSDLNSPIMKKMLLTASGTYNHSIMVATLAESACREIGADPLLARVGAYYHDIGKMDQSEYFIENQSDHNRHVDINPRLSATVIRSHVKQGMEKARQMRLPREVIDIISEHHGNSLISYFYSEEKKVSEDVDPEDFTYPGNPPKTRESAVVMLADVVEAACRTLEKPSVTRLEKFIDELINYKIETKQLDNCDLTFREVGIIKKTFLKILAGYYHSRIEYPNQKSGESGEAERVQEPITQKGIQQKKEPSTTRNKRKKKNNG